MPWPDMPVARKNWIAVASAEPARRGRDEPGGGFMQVCHGKCGPLQRVQPGDRVAYYAPTATMGAKDRLQRFVSIGVVQPGVPYAFDMGGGYSTKARRYVLSWLCFDAGRAKPVDRLVGIIASP